MKKVLVFGSTGSIGRSSLDVIRKARADFKVLGLCVNRDIKNLKKQIEEFSPSYVCVVDSGCADKLAASLDKRIKLFRGESGLQEFSSLNSDISIMGISGISCLRPLLINLEHTARIALANKEAIVGAGSFVFMKAKKFGVEIIPVDSEINALFQLVNAIKDDFLKVYITASGGPLLNCKKKDLKDVGVKEVLLHPTWKMGRRITVDSATFVNKAFEVIEVNRFFRIPYERIGVLIHKESAIHALVELKDNNIFACFYPPDMKMPISFALYYPLRSNSLAEKGVRQNFSLSLEPFNYKKHPLFEMVLDAARKDDNSLAILNASDEVAINYFLAGKIKFTHIRKVMEYIFTHYPSQGLKKVEDVFYWDTWARKKTEEYIEKEVHSVLRTNN
ncbi:MAG: 1-deoxy-D-xylulose-5-phosphate reductoisomerase [Candidatus Omnitrophota bacterium]|nr:MAG: 1-deoxy-D-xylulose-5-phosphate reductoisomerase [Candidatus Omnitrophota bacterium]